MTLELMLLTVVLAFVLVALLGFSGCALRHAVRAASMRPRTVLIIVESRSGPVLDSAMVAVLIDADAAGMRPAVGPSRYRIDRTSLTLETGSPALGTSISPERTATSLAMRVFGARDGVWNVQVTAATTPTPPPLAVGPTVSASVPFEGTGPFVFRFAVDAAGRTIFERAG